MIKQVLSIEEMQYLQKLGLDINKASCFYDIHKPTNSSELFWGYEDYNEDSNDIMFEVIPTFTSQDILDILPKEIIINNKVYELNIMFPNEGLWEISYCSYGECKEYFIENNIIDASYKMLCWCIENDYLKVNKV